MSYFYMLSYDILDIYFGPYDLYVIVPFTVCFCFNYFLIVSFNYYLINFNCLINFNWLIDFN